ncbi:MAG: CPBP family intramembrane metalloprotease [Acidobacteria bacterium]|nr:MAG: CPBP family intramembrane metalloprotease [Acidobacteriota bacterium]
MGEEQQAPQPPVAEPPARPSLPPGLRVAFYLLLIIVVLHFGSAALIQLLDPDLARALAAAATPAELEALQATIPFALVLLIQCLLAPVVLAATWFLLQRFERRSLADVGFRLPGGAGRQAVIAVAGVGALAVIWLLFTSVVAELRFTGWAEPFAGGDGLRPLGGWGPLPLYLAGFLVAAGLEELIFRGYVYSTLCERLSWVNAAGISGVLWVVLHAGNPELGAIGLINTFLLALSLAILRQQTGSLWAATICHGTWNFMIGCVLSLPVSGLEVYPLFTVEVAGEEAITGGAYGPEGSLLLTALLLPVVAVLAYLLIDGQGPEDADADRPI